MYIDTVMEHMHEEYADMYLCRNAENGELPCFFDGYDPVAYVQYVITETGYMKEITLLLDNSLYSNILNNAYDIVHPNTFIFANLLLSCFMFVFLSRRSSRFYIS